MKLSKLYCNKDFHNISFITKKGGVNFIVGDSKGEKQHNLGKTKLGELLVASDLKGEKQHNLGKTKLGELLDFMLIKKVTKDFFFYTEMNKSKFTDHVFYLEILLNDGRYVTIKRSVAQPTKIAFKINDKISDEYILYNTFDVELPFDRAKNFLNELLHFNFCIENGENYRQLVNYSLRTQGDYDPKKKTIFQLSKFLKSKDEYWKPVLFNLLGFSGDILKQKYEIENKLKRESKDISTEEKKLNIKYEDIGAIREKIKDYELAKQNLSQELESFNFYTQDKELIYNLVGEIEQEIANLNTDLYNLEFDIKKLQDSIRNDFSFDLKKVETIFAEVNLYFPEQLSKNYQQLLNFNHQITQERNLLIRETLQEKEELYRQVNAKLIELNKKREEFRDLIQDTSLFKKYSTYQKKLINIEKELSGLQTQLTNIERIEKEKQCLDDIKQHELQKIVSDLKDIISNRDSNKLYMNIRKTFSDIVKDIFLDENASITVNLNSHNNVEFKSNSIGSSQADGNSYYKICCIAFDLAILINYRESSYFRFVYHDNAISDDDNGVKSRFIETICEIAEKYDIQYIFSAIKDNLPLTPNLSQHIVLELHDKDNSGKLFKMAF
jgi:uncharacterized protein YydD (DUF2326 family)